jgi:CubicO group peptidase (beta-lactamase class C family)
VTRGSAGLDPGGIARFAAMLRRHVGPRDPGAVALLTRGDDTHVEAVGSRDVATGAPMQRDALVRIASMTKPVTALAALALVERGVLALDQPVDPWLPELADRRVLRAGMSGALDDVVPAARAITLRDLLSLQLGLGAIMAKPGTHPIQRALAEAKIAPGLDGLDVTHDEYLARIGALPLVHQPGAGWLYHIGLEIAGILVARAGPLMVDFERLAFGAIAA